MTAKELIKAFQGKQGGSAGYAQLGTFLRDAVPAELEAFAAQAIVAFPKGGNFIDEVLTYLTPAAYKRLVAQAVALAEEGKSPGACEAVFIRASLQAVGSLQPHLDQLFELEPTAGAEGEYWPWHGAKKADIEGLLDRLETGKKKERFHAWRCLLESRQPKAIAAAIAAIPRIPLEQPAQAYLHQVDHALDGSPLYRKACMHILFPVDGDDDDGALHPTRVLPADDTPHAFGGEGTGQCGLCGEGLHHLLTVPEAFIFDVESEAPLALETCLSCMGWESPVLFYQHGADGTPSSLNQGDATPDNHAVALEPAEVTLAPTPPRWQFQSWGYANGDNLNRIGGAPSWIQSADYPACPSCGELMHFALQLDSDLPASDGDEWAWGSGGLCYGFQCTPCRVTAFTWQCT